MKKYCLLAVAMLLTLAGCQEKEQQKDPETPKDKIEVNPTELNFGEQGGEEPVVVTSSGDWILESKETYDWIKTDITEGKDGDIVTFKAKSNYTGKDLTAVYEFKTGTAVKEFIAISKTGEAKTLELTSEPSLEMNYKTGQVHVQLKTNVSYRSFENTVIADEEGWCTFKFAREGDDNTATMVFELAENTGRENRSAQLNIKATGDGTESLAPITVSVIQRAKPVITTDKQEYVIPAEGGSVDMIIDANVEYEISIDEAGSKWLTCSDPADGKVVLTAGSIGAKPNVAVITLTEKNPLAGEEALVVTVPVKQVAATIINRAIDMSNSRTWPDWSNEPFGKLFQMSNFTWEVLFKAKNFGPEGTISTIMGIEDYFLLRFGDNTVAPNQIQWVSQWEYTVTDKTLQFEEDKWYHLAMTFDNSCVIFYVDGKEVFRDHDTDWVPSKIDFNKPHTESESQQRCFWVGYSYAVERDFKGLMSEIRFWNKTLTPEEINAENHFYTVDPESEGLLGYWKFADCTKDEQGRTIIEDATGQGSPMVFEKHDGGKWLYDAEPTFEEVSLP